MVSKYVLLIVSSNLEGPQVYLLTRFDCIYIYICTYIRTYIRFYTYIHTYVSICGVLSDDVYVGCFFPSYIRMYIYRDLKPENILIHNDGYLKVCVSCVRVCVCVYHMYVCMYMWPGSMYVHVRTYVF